MTASPSHSRRTRMRIVLAALFLLLSLCLIPGGPSGADEVLETGFQGTDGPDTIVAIGPVGVFAEMDVLGIDILGFGTGDFTGTVIASATASGVLALAGEDVIVLSDPVVTVADSTATGAVVSGSLTGDASAVVTVHADATTTAVDGGDNADNITSVTAIRSDASANAVATNVAIAIDTPLNNSASPGDALVDAQTVASTNTTVVSAGSGDDQVHNSGPILATVDASATNVGVSFGMDFGSNANVDAGAAISRSSNEAIAAVTGIDGGAGADTINNHESIVLVADADATAVNVGLAIGGTIRGDATSEGALSQSETNALASATGITGGDGDDTIVDTGAVTVRAETEAVAVAGNYQLTVSQQGDVAAGGGVSDASTRADSRATGIDGGDGDDMITAIQARTEGLTVDAESDAVGITASFSVAGSLRADAAGGEAASETRVEADSHAVGIDGGAGSDTVTSRIDIDTGADAAATGVSVAWSAGVSRNGDVTSGDAVSQASTIATADATGIDGGDMDDEIGGETGTGGNITTTADATATGVSVSFSVGGSVKGSADSGDALSEARTEAYADAAAIEGGEGGDEIINAARIDTDAVATAAAVGAAFSVGVSAQGEVTNADASAEGGAMSDASSIASATAIGLAGGGDDDTIASIGTGERHIDLDANSTATGVAASFNVGGSVKGDAAAGDALSSARTDADARTIGISGGSGSDTITSQTTILADSDATATAVAAGISVGIAKEGNVTAGSSVSDASSHASSSAIGIDGGTDDDTIGDENGITGDIDVNANSTATGVAASITFAGTAKGDASSGDALSSARTEADARTTGISGGSGSDTITSGAGIDADSLSTSTAISAGFDVTISKDGDVSAGAAVSDASSHAETLSVGIDGGDGGDEIMTITGGDFAVDSYAESNAYGVAASFTVAGTAKGGASTGDALSEARTDAAATAIGISGGEGDDTIAGDARIDAEAKTDAVAVSAAFSVGITADGDAQAGAAVSDASSLAVSQAVGIDAGGGDDTIGGDAGISGTITTMAESDAVGVAASFSVAGTAKGNAAAGDALSEARTDAEARSTGIAGGLGDDDIHVITGIVSDADATATAVSAGFSVEITKTGDSEGEVSGAAALSDASSLAVAGATAIEGGSGDDDIITSGEQTEILDVHADAQSTGVAASITVSGQMQGDVGSGGAISQASVTSDAEAVAIDSGDDDDEIDNTKDIVAASDATATGVSVGVYVGITADGDITNENASADGMAVSDASGSADATSIAITAGDGSDKITNAGVLDVQASSDVLGVAVSLGVAGSASGDVAGGAASDASVVAQSTAIGIDGGSGSDTIFNDGEIRVMDEKPDGADENADATATAVAVSLDVTGSLSGDTSGDALSDTSSTAIATGTGIAGGAGVDSIDNLGNIIADVGADSTAVSVGIKAGISIGGDATGAALSDSSTNSVAMATAIDGGDDADDIDNLADLDMHSSAESDSVSVSVTLTGSIGGTADGAAVASASANSNATSTGIEGGGGDDYIDTTGATFDDENVYDVEADEHSIYALASSDAAADSVAVVVSGAIGAANAAALADASANADAAATGIGGGEGDDTIDNASRIDAYTNTVAEANATSVSVTLGLGETESDGLGDSSATAIGTAIGIDGGGGDDTITNIATLTAGRTSDFTMAQAEAGSTTVGVGITLGVANSTAESNAAALAEATAAGISGGAGSDTITNSGTIIAGTAADAYETGVAPQARALAGSQTVKVGITLGEADSQSSSDSSATAISDISAIAGGDGADTITNTSTGQLNAVSSAEAKSESKTTSVELSLGSSQGFVSADATSHAIAISAAVDGGAGNDTITVDGGLYSSAEAQADAESASLSLSVINVGKSVKSAAAFGSSSAEATARGVYGGTGNDTLDADGTILVAADSDVTSTIKATVQSGFGVGDVAQHAQSEADTTARSLAVGLDGGSGDDRITGAAVMEVHSTATATSTADSHTDSGFNLAGTSKGEATSDARATVIASSIGIRGGEQVLENDETDDDTISISKTATVSAESTGKSTSTADADASALFGGAEGSSVSDASAVVRAAGTGIEGGAGDDTITTTKVVEDGQIVSRGDLAVTATAGTEVVSTATVEADATFGDAGATGASDASVDMLSEVMGIDAGAGSDTVNLDSLIDLSAIANGVVSSTSTATADSTFSDASSGSASDASALHRSLAIGVLGGEGEDALETSGDAEVLVTAVVSGDVTSISRAEADSWFGDASSNTASAASSTGISESTGVSGGAGDDDIDNLGRVSVSSDTSLSVVSVSTAKADSGIFGDSYAGAASDTSIAGRAVAVGITGDGGTNEIDTTGSLEVSARSITNVTSMTAAIAESRTTAASRNSARSEVVASGIEGGEGADSITTGGTVAIAGESTITAAMDVYSSRGPASSDARTLATADVSGIRTSGGEDTITAGGDFVVAAAPGIQQTNRTFGKNGLVKGDVGITLQANASGIDAGSGADYVTNDGTLLVVVGRQSDSTATISTTGSGDEMQRVLVDASLVDRPPEDLVGKWLRIDVGDGKVMFTVIKDFDPTSGTITTHDQLPMTLAGTPAYTMFDVDGGADIALNTATIGAVASVNAATEAIVGASGITGGGGDDTIMNNGDLAVRASNSTVAGIRTVSGAASADLSTRSNVQSIGIDGDAIGTNAVDGADSVNNVGNIVVDALSRTDFSSAEWSFAGSDLTAEGTSIATATGMRGGAMADSLTSEGTLDVNSMATILASDRAESYFGNIDQQLAFSATSSAIGFDAGSDNDVLVNADTTKVTGTAQASVLGYSDTADFWLAWLGIFQSRSTNLVDATVTSSSHGVNLGTGTDSIDNTGTLTVRSTASPVTDYVALARSDQQYGETGARATAVNHATAVGISGDAGDVSSSGIIDVLADSVSTSFAQAAAVLVADDQSEVTEISAADEQVFVDSALAGSTADFAGKEMRFLADGVEFERQDSTISAIGGDTDTWHFRDDTARNLDPSTVIGTNVRFSSTSGEDPDYVGEVAAYNDTTGEFTLVDPLPTDSNDNLLVNTNDGYVLSVLTATVTTFDASTGTFELDEVVPDGVTGEAYTLSIVSNPATLRPGAYSFTDITRGGEEPGDLVGNWISFPDQPGFAGVIESFDTNTGHFVLTCDDCTETFNVASGEIYQLSATRNGTSGSTAVSHAYGIDVIGGNANVYNSGDIDVTATAQASTTVNATYGAGTASADAVASAWGIRTGDGDDNVTNADSGTIEVVASAMASSNIDVQTIQASATGITTGAGDDIVTNDGTVSAMTIVDDTEVDGTAIDLGEGADVLQLGDGSSTTGFVDLGPGDDVMILIGNPVIETLGGDPLNPTGGDGVNELGFMGTGSFASIPLDFERAVKYESGTFELVELPTLEYLRIEDGELALASDYIFADDGLFETVFYTDGRNGQLSVDGAVDLGGTMDVQRVGDEFIADGTRYTLVSATGSVDDEFATITLPEAMPLLHFELDQESTSLDLVAVAKSFETIAENPMQQRIAGNLYGLSHDSGGEFSRTLGRMQTMPDGFGRTLQSFSPDIHQVASEGATKVMQQGTAILQSHLRTSRSRYRDGGHAPDPIGELAMFYNSAGYGGVKMTGAAAQAASGGTGPRQTRSQGWMLGMASRGDYDAVSGYTGFEQNTDAFAAGYDFHVNGNVIIGLSLGTAETTLEMSDAYGTGLVDGWSANAYGTWFTESSYVEWGLGYGAHEVETSRLLEIGTDAREASGSHDGDALSLFFGGGKLYRFDRWLVEPFAAVRYFRLGEDTFEETGADELNQRIDSRDTKALFGDLGINVGQRMQLKSYDAMFDWNMMLGVNHDFDIDERRLDYSYVGQPGEILSLTGRGVSGTSGLLGGTLAWYGERLGLNLEYRGRFNSDYDEQAIAAIFLLQF